MLIQQEKLPTNIAHSVVVKKLGLCPYRDIWLQMQNFTRNRTADTLDEIWQLEHLPVFTLGQAGKPEHLLNPKDIPIITTDRGGQVTYHGPGQLIIYLLVNLARKNLTIKQMLSYIQNAVIDLLASYKVTAIGDATNPGVYVENAKVCSIGLKVHKGSLYHGLSLNVNMDLEPFSRINPCGQKNLPITQLADLDITADLNIIADLLTTNLITALNYRNIIRQ